MEKTRWLPLIDPERCTHCGLCVKVCPTQVLGQVDGRITVVNPEACTYCGQCEQLCPENAVALPYQIVMTTPPDSWERIS